MKVKCLGSWGKRFLLASMIFAMGVTGLAEEVRVGSLVLETPEGWYQTAIPSDEPYARAVVASDSKPAEQALVMVSVAPSEGRSLESLTAATRNFIATQMDGVLEYERSTTLDGAPAHTFVYEGRSEHSRQGRRKFMRTIVERDNSFYIVHGVADHVPFANYAGAMESMLNTAKWSN